MQTVEQPEEDAQTELQEHKEAYICHRLGTVDLEDLGHEAEHGQNGSAPAD